MSTEINAYNAEPGHVLLHADGESVLGIVRENQKRGDEGTLTFSDGTHVTYDADMTFMLLPVCVEVVPGNEFLVCEDDPDTGATFDSFASGEILSESPWFDAEHQDTELYFGVDAQNILGRLDGVRFN